AMVPRRVRVGARAAERPVEHHHPRETELVAQPVHGRRDQAEVLRDYRQLAERALDGAEELGARAAAPVAAPRRLVLLRDRPVGDEAAEVIDPRDVDELEHAAEALDPPA